MKSIRSRILFNMIGGLISLALIIGVISALFSIRSTIKSTEKTLTETAKLAASNVEGRLENYETLAFEVGSLSSIADPTNIASIKKEIIDQKVSYYGFVSGNIVGTDGISPLNNDNVSSLEFFNQSLQGNTWISEPLLNPTNGNMEVVISAPIWQNGVPATNNVVGVLYFTQNVDILIDIVKDITIGKNGTAYILNKNGVTIAHPDKSIVQNMENTQELVKTDPELLSLSVLEKEMTLGNTGFGEYQYNNVKKYLSYAPIDVTGQWSIAISVGKNEFMQYVNQSILTVTIISVLLLFLFGLISVKVAHHISKPITRVAKRLELMAQGDLHTPVEVVKTRDETHLLCVSAKKTAENLNAYIDTIGFMLNEISTGNLAVQRPDIVFEGDFIKLDQSLNNILLKFTRIMFDIQQNALQVSLGSDQLSSGAQILSQGATEQASSIDELVATLENITQKIHTNAENAKLAQNESQTAGINVQHSNSKMLDMIDAMNDISNKSGEIGKIIKTINDIAFQTNILALNAAVEAARAGAAGKGFAVVADEVRNLAGKSAEAVKNTTSLIEETVSAVKNGVDIANDTATSLGGVVSGTNTLSKLINEISNASTEQAEAMAQVSIGIEQISSVVQNNSATAQESAASSEELNGQATMLKELVNSFKLRKL